MRARPANVLVAAGLLVLAATACIRDESGLVSTQGVVTKANLPPCPLAALAKAKGTVNVELWHAMAGKAKEEIEALGKRFNASQSKVNVQVKSQGTDYAEVLRKYQSAIPSGQLPAIAYLEDVNLRLLVDGRTLLPAESCMKADDSDPGLLPAVRNYYTADDVFWPGYVNVSEPVLYFNENHFTKAGLDPAKPPRTLDELETAARALKRSGVDKPLALKLDSWFVESWVNGAGALVVNKDNGRAGSPNASEFDNPVTRKVFNWIKRMQDEGLLDPISDTAGQIDQYLALATKTSSMTIETSTAATTIKAFLGGEDVGQGGVDTGGATANLTDLKPAAAALPGVDEPGRVRISGGAFYMTNTSKPEVQAGAWAFMRFMQRVSNQVEWHLVGSYLPATQAAANDPKVKAFWRDDLAGRILAVAYGQLLAVDPRHPGPTIGPYPKYDDAIQNALDSMAFKGVAPDEAVATADKEIDQVLRRYAEDNAN